MLSTMKTTIDRAGRVVIPKRIREQAGLTPGAEIEVRYCDGHVEVEAAETEIRIEDRDGFPVAVAVGTVPVLTDAMLQRVIDEVRAERGSTSSAEDQG